MSEESATATASGGASSGEKSVFTKIMDKQIPAEFVYEDEHVSWVSG